MDMNNVNRQHKDRLFKAIFGAPEHKDYALSLYNAVNGTHYDNADELVYYTIEDAVYMGMKNDLSFIFDAALNLYEQQSSFNPNMPLRGLMYLSKQYEKYAEENHLNLYRDILQRIPAPKYIVFYNGTELQKDKMELKLSDAFIRPVSDAALEVRAVMLNINYGQNKRIMNACTPLNDYAKFISCVKMNQRRGLPVAEAVDAAMEMAISENLLDGYFAVHKAEVIGMILTEYDEEFVHKGWYKDGLEKGIEQGLAQGLEQGLAQGLEQGLAKEKANTILRMTDAGFSTDQIATATEAPIEMIQKIQSVMKQ